MVSIEAWERFSFYGMQAILVYYLYYATTEGGLGIEKTQATALLGAYGALLYLCTFIGGWLGDRLLGAEKTLLLGAGMLVTGHLVLSFGDRIPALALGLTLIAVGSGSLKTAAITILGAVYGDRGADRDVGFQYFYLGIQFAAVGGPLLTGYLSTAYSFHVGFGAAAVLMILGVVIYLALRAPMLAQVSETTRYEITHPPTPAAPRAATVSVTVGVLVLGGVVVATASGALSPTQLARALLVAIFATAGVMYALMLRSPAVSAAERRRMIVYIPVFLAACAFYSLANQIYGVLAVYSDLRLDRHVLGFEIPAAWTQAINPFFFALFAVPIAYLWHRLGTKAPASATKMSLGVVIAGFGMFVLLPYTGGGENSTPFAVLAGAILVITVGELFVGPIGMAATTAHAPRAFRTRFSALYFLTLAIGNSLAGTISEFYDPSSKAAEDRYFLLCGLVAIAVGVATLFLGRYLAKRER